MGRAAKGRSHRQFPRAAARTRKSPPPSASRARRPTRKPGRPDAAHRLRHAHRHRQEDRTCREFNNIRKGGIIAIQIEEGDRLIDAKLTSGDDEIVLITQEGMSLRFNEEELRDQGRNTVGVWGIRPEQGDLRRRHGHRQPGRHAARRRRKRHRQAHRLRRIPQAIPRRQRHHHHEDRRQDRRRRRRADRPRARTS